MSRNPVIVSLFDKYGFAVRRTDPDASHKILQMKVLKYT